VCVSESEKEGMLETADDVTPAGSVDVCSDEPARMSPVAVSADEVIAVAVVDSQQPVAEGDDDDEVPLVLCQPLQPDESARDGSELLVLNEVADGQEVEVGVEMHDGDAEASEDAVGDGGVADDAEQKLDGASLDDDLQSGQFDTAAADNDDGKSSEIQPRISDDSADSTNVCRRIDWDALEKPKQKSSVEENVEFSRVFNRVVKCKSDAENRDPPAVSAESSLSPTDLSEPHAKSAATSEVAGETDGKAGETKQNATLQLSSSTSDDQLIETDKSRDEQVEIEKSVITVDQQTEPLELALSSNSSSPSVRQLSPRAEASAVVPETRSQNDIAMPTSLHQYSASARKTKSHNEDIKPSSPVKESPTAKEPCIESTSFGEESLTMIKTKPSSEDSSPSAGTQTSGLTETKPCSEGTSPSSAGKQTSAVTKTKPCDEDTSPSPPGMQSSDSTTTTPHVTGTSPPSPNKECSTVTQTRPCDEDVSVKQQVEDIATEFGAKSVADPQSDKPRVNPDELKKEESFQTKKAKFGNSSSDVSLPEPDACAAAGELDSVTSHSIVTSSSSPCSQTKANDQPASSSPVTEATDHRPVIPAESAGLHDSGTSDRLSGEDKPTGADVSTSASTLELHRDEENAAEAGPCSTTTSYVAKPVAQLRKNVVERRSSAKVQPSEPKNEEPAWIMAARRKSDKWNEGRAEELERKPQKPAADIDNEVCSYRSPDIFRSTLLSRPNKLGLKCLSVRMYVRS